MGRSIRAVAPRRHLRSVQRADRLAAPAASAGARRRSPPSTAGTSTAARSTTSGTPATRPRSATSRSWVPFAEHCRRALAATYAELGADRPTPAPTPRCCSTRSATGRSGRTSPRTCRALAPAAPGRHPVQRRRRRLRPHARSRPRRSADRRGRLTSERLRRLQAAPGDLPAGPGAGRRRPGARGDLGARRARGAGGRHRRRPAAPARAPSSTPPALARGQAATCAMLAGERGAGDTGKAAVRNPGDT